MAKIMVGGCIRAGRVPGFKTKVKISIRWIEKNHRRDFDNIENGAKVILDALRACEIIVNDSQKWLAPIHHVHEVDPANPRIEVTIHEDEDVARSGLSRTA